MLFLAALIHGILIIGITFNAYVLDDLSNAISLEVTIVADPDQSIDRPDEAEYLAQASQEGGGNTLEELRARLGAFDEQLSVGASADETSGPHGAFYVLYEDGRAVPGPQPPEDLAATVAFLLSEGALTLTGQVLPVGGIREKVIAARRAGIKELIMPHENRGDFDEIPDYIRKGLKVSFARTFGDVAPLLFR